MFFIHENFQSENELWRSRWTERISSADIIGTHYMRALKAARDDRVKNWRLIDTFDNSNKDYMDFEYLGIIEKSEAKNPQKPLEQIVA